MKPRPPLPPPPYLVVGLARSGVAVALALRRAEPSARIVGCDSGRSPEAGAEAERLAEAGVEIHLDTDGTELLAGSQPPRTLVKSPGVPAHAQVVSDARTRGIEVLGELEIGWRLVPNEFCAVTGTNGKTTTVELIGEIYRAAGRPVAVAGNVGTAVSAHAGSLSPSATVVCEASSFQLEDSDRFSPEIAVFLNFSEDHLDRHDTVEQYLDAKVRIFEHQSSEDVAVLNAAEPALRRRALPGAAQRVWFGVEPDCALRLKEGKLYWEDNAILDASEVALRGPHNLENAMAASAATLVRGVDADSVKTALREFGGIAHRLEGVGEVGGVLYVNDSKATNVSATIAALRSFEGGVHVILGGSLKGSGRFGALNPVVAQRCSAAYLIGEAADRIKEDLRDSEVELADCAELERAVSEASRRARPGETVLLAPACASFDQYRDFEERGEHFRVLVERLIASSGANG